MSATIHHPSEARPRTVEPEDAIVVLFDGTCAVCRRSIEWLQARVKQTQLVCLPSQDPEVARRFPQFTSAQLDAEMHVIEPDGTVTRGADAVETLVAVMEGARRMAWLFRVPGGRRLAGFGYRLLARNRHRFGCGDHCSLRHRA